MEDTQADSPIPEKLPTPTQIQDLHQSIINNEESQQTNNNKMPKKPLSQAQIDHLKYARDCKRLKATSRDNDRQVTNTNLDFIYRRLTNIESQLRSMVDPQSPVTTFTNATPVRLGKRKNEVSEHHDINIKDPDYIEPTSKKSKKEDVEEKGSWDYIKEYATRGALMFGAGLVFSLTKQYLIRNGAERTTQDGEQIGPYYTGADY